MAQNYSFRAEELRSIAELDDHVKTREMLLEVARDYDRMARTMTAIEDTNRVLGKG